MKGCAPKASLSHRNFVRGLGGLRATVSWGSRRLDEADAAEGHSSSQRKRWHQETKAVGRRGGSSHGWQLCRWREREKKA